MKRKRTKVKFLRWALRGYSGVELDAWGIPILYSSRRNARHNRMADQRPVRVEVREL